MYSILKSTVNGKVDCSQADTTAASPDPNPTDLWLFTDPLAREIYRRQGQLEALEEDITTDVMVQGEWAPEDLECKCEIRRLLREGRLSPGSSFGDKSPHPTVYHASGEGVLNIDGRRFPFDTGDDLVFEPWLARVTHPGLTGPIRVGWLHQATRLCLSSEAFPQVCIHCDHTLAVLRKALRVGNSRTR